jgi:hypothetical protein
MILYLLISVQCMIKEPAKNFSINCKPKVNQFFMEEKDCRSKMTDNMTCIQVKLK